MEHPHDGLNLVKSQPATALVLLQCYDGHDIPGQWPWSVFYWTSPRSLSSYPRLCQVQFTMPTDSAVSHLERSPSTVLTRAPHVPPFGAWSQLKMACWSAKPRTFRGADGTTCGSDSYCVAGQCLRRSEAAKYQVSTIWCAIRNWCYSDLWLTMVLSYCDLDSSQWWMGSLGTLGRLLPYLWRRCAVLYQGVWQSPTQKWRQILWGQENSVSLLQHRDLPW